MDTAARLLDPGIIGVFIPIVAIVAGGAVVLTRQWFRHRERIAMIEMGIHPDREEPPALDPGDPEELDLGRRLPDSARR